jgi:hypothetical protein
VTGTMLTMGQWVGRIIGIVLVLVGGLWALQGLGVVGGSAMTRSTAWLVIGLVQSAWASPCSCLRSCGGRDGV